MHLFRPSRRGTWLIAAAMWLIGCAILWWTLPVAPQMTVPNERGTLGFAPDAQTTLFQRAIPDANRETGGPTVELQLRNSSTGLVFKSLGSFGQSESGPARSTGGWFWLVRDRDEFDEQRKEIVCRFLKIDLAMQSTTKLSCLRSVIEGRIQLELGPGGRYCVLLDPNDIKPALIWDLVNNQFHSVEPEIVGPIAFSHDGRYVAARSKQDLNSAQVIDLESLTTIAILRAPDSPVPTGPGSQPRRLVRLLFNDDNSRLAAECWPANGGQLICWHIAMGKIEAACSGYLVGFTDHGTSLVTNDLSFGVKSLSIHDLRENEVRLSFQTPASWPCLLSLDGLTVLAPTQESGASLFERFSALLGFRWPFDRGKDRIRCRLYDISTGNQIGEFLMNDVTAYARNLLFQMAFDLIPDGRITVLDDGPWNWSVYNVPPRKSLRAFGIYAAIIAAVVVVFAKWRLRRLNTFPGVSDSSEVPVVVESSLVRP